jgi:hypothetical protein
VLLLDLSITHWVPGAALMSPATLDHLTGSNTGNFAFRYAVAEQFFPGTPLGTFEPGQPLPGRRGTVVMACANWIGRSAEHEVANANRFAYLDRIDMPVVPFGLGCQLPLGAVFDDLGLATKKFLLRLCELAPSMSVRDEQTAQMLHTLGYRSVHITGCPSNFINPDPDLGASIAAAARRLLERDAGWDSIATCLTEYSGGYDFSSQVFEQHFAMMRDHAATYVVQDYPLLPVLMRSTGRLPQEYMPQQFPGTGATPNEMALVLRRCAVYFASYDQWLLQARRFDLGYGMRLHGNLTTLQAGVPSLVITHDARTVESCRTLGLPNMGARDFVALEPRTPRPLLECILGSAIHYDARRRELALRMQDHLRQCSLPLPPGLRRLVAEVPEDLPSDMHGVELDAIR